MCQHCRRLSVQTTDRGFTSLRSVFIRARKVEEGYATRLRKIAAHVGEILSGFDATTLPGSIMARAALDRYAEILKPWATSVGQRMVAEVAARDRKAWEQVGADMGRALHREIDTAPTGVAMRTALNDQVRLITSLPTEAGERVHRLTLKGITEGTRADTIAAEIARTGEVTKARATLIARTEVARTAATLTQSRAEHIGSTHFIWRTVGDSDVRPSHRALNGKTFAWAEPPECDPGHHALPGCIWNCRCYAEPIIPD